MTHTGDHGGSGVRERRFSCPERPR